MLRRFGCPATRTIHNNIHLDNWLFSERSRKQDEYSLSSSSSSSSSSCRAASTDIPDHLSLSFIAISSELHPVSSQSCCMYVCMYVRAGRPAFARPYVGVHRSPSLTSSSPLLQLNRRKRKTRENKRLRGRK